MTFNSENTEDFQEVKILLPLPLDIAGEIMSAVGAKYPNTMIKTNSSPGIGTGNTLTLLIPNEDRFENWDEDNDEEAALVPIATAGKTPADEKEFIGELARMDETGIGFNLPEAAASMFLEMSSGITEMFPDAENYVEMNFNDPEGGAWLWTIQKPKGLSPHALRGIAESRAEAAERKVTELISAVDAALGAEALTFLATHPNPDIAKKVSEIITEKATQDLNE